MRIFLPVRRATILIQSGPAHDPDRFHLFILLNDPVPPRDGEVLIVPCSSVHQDRYYDSACELPARCHAFITKNSFADYRWARIEKADQLLKGVRDNLFVPHESLDEEHFAKVYKGVFISRHISLKNKQCLQQSHGSA